MISTSKSALMTELEKSATNVEQVPRPHAVSLMGWQWCVKSEIRCIDIVFDVHREISKKNAERGHKKFGRLHYKKIKGSQ